MCFCGGGTTTDWEEVILTWSLTYVQRQKDNPNCLLYLGH